MVAAASDRFDVKTTTKSIYSTISGATAKIFANCLFVAEVRRSNIIVLFLDEYLYYIFSGLYFNSSKV